MEISCATYNILHGYHRDLVLKNIRFLIEQGADVICVQEADAPFENELRENLLGGGLQGWRVGNVREGVIGDCTVLWNAKRLTLRSMEMLRLPLLPWPSILLYLKGIPQTLQRVALIAQFTCEGMPLTIVNAHLALEGSMLHRLNQLRVLKRALDAESSAPMILCGDFNTLAFRPFRNAQSRIVQKILGPQFVNALPHLRWTCDLSYTDPRDKWEFLKPLMKLGFKFRIKLDYIFARNLRVLSGAMHDLPGSDHRPLIARLSRDLL